jgi:hypothetical protein
LISKADPSPSWRTRALPGVLFAALVIAVYADPLLVRRNFVGRDLLVYNLPMEKSVHDAYSRGRLPVWSPEMPGRSIPCERRSDLSRSPPQSGSFRFSTGSRRESG